MEKAKVKYKFPHAIVFVLCICLLMVILSWIIPAGTYLSVDANGVVQGSEGYDASTGSPVYDNAYYYNTGIPVKVGLWAAIKYIVMGFGAAKSIVFLILVAFSTISLIESTGALDALVASSVRLAERRPASSPIIIVVIMFLLALWGGTGTLSYEEIGAFIPIFLVLCISLGYDPLVALATCVLSMGFGFASGYVNPFTTGVADSITGLAQFSGMGYRLICLVVTVGFLAFYILRYGAQIKKDPGKSITADIDYSGIKIDDTKKQTKFTLVRTLTLIALVCMIGMMVYELMFKSGTVDTVTALFLALTLIIGFIRWFVPLIENAIAKKEVETPHILSDSFRDWIKGMGSAVLPAIVVGFAYGVSYIMAYGGIKDPIIHGMANLLGKTNIYVGAVGMLIFQSLLNFLVPSGSGQAAIAMPLMAPIAKSIGLNLQSATLAFNFGDGYSNILWPTSFGVLAPVLAGIPVGRYYKWLLKFFGWVFLILIVLLIISIFLWQGNPAYA